MSPKGGDSCGTAEHKVQNIRYRWLTNKHNNLKKRNPRKKRKYVALLRGKMMNNTKFLSSHFSSTQAVS